ncbi:maleylpyruvate isomerase family mycothiol-dependent enzyme, partial [Acidimicrobiaceae bacterium USS-CC1]|nr:maleylpyruvate isomerase family mycothiol-dependent enzyme [Acidiferrimicrobium australe]
PDWSVGDLLEHTGSVHRWAAAVVEGGERVRRRDLPAGPPGDAVLDWFAEGLERLTGVLLASDPARRVWSFAAGSPSTVAWWVRRMAQETGMHRRDVEAAGGGAVRGFDPRRAADGIDEYLFDFLPGIPDEDLAALSGPGGGGGSLHLHATDTGVGGGGEWVVDL